MKLQLTVNRATDIDGKLTADSINISGTDVTASAAELNIMDGVTATEINKLDGFTGTAQKLNFVNNVTSDIQGQLNNRYTKSEADAAFGTLSMLVN